MQWANINKKYRQSIRQNDKGFTTSEDEDATEEILNDVTEGDQIRGKPKVNVECALLQQTHSPGVISDSHELEDDEHFLDTQYLNYDEDTVNQEEGHSDVTEEDNETKAEFDAQSLGLNSSHNDSDQYEEDDAKLTEDQRDAKRGLGM